MISTTQFHQFVSLVSSSICTMQPIIILKVNISTEFVKFEPHISEYQNILSKS